MRNGRSGSRSASPQQALPDGESDDRAGKQSSAIHDDIDWRVQVLLTGLVPASVCDNRATQVASAWLQGQMESRVAPTGPTPRLHQESPRLTGSACSDVCRTVQAPQPSLGLRSQEGWFLGRRSTGAATAGGHPAAGRRSPTRGPHRHVPHGLGAQRQRPSPGHQEACSRSSTPTACSRTRRP
jgi:hypothetical protein